MALAYSGPGPPSAQPHPQTLRSRLGGPGLMGSRRASVRSVRAWARPATAAPAIAAPPTAAALAGLGDGELAAADLVPVQLLDGALGLFGRAHLDEAEAAGLSGGPVCDDRGRLDRADTREEVVQLLVGCGEGQVPHEELLAHRSLLAGHVRSGPRAPRPGGGPLTPPGRAMDTDDAGDASASCASSPGGRDGCHRSSGRPGNRELLEESRAGSPGRGTWAWGRLAGERAPAACRRRRSLATGVRDARGCRSDGWRLPPWRHR